MKSPDGQHILTITTWTPQRENDLPMKSPDTPRLPPATTGDLRGAAEEEAPRG